MEEKQPFVDGTYVLRKFRGKGGWTYTEVRPIKRDKPARFEWVGVSGFIDNFELKNHRLMPMISGNFFLTVKTQIRKKIKKEAGDTVRVILYADVIPKETPQEIIDCLKMESKAVYDKYLALSNRERQNYLDWIYTSKSEEIKADRIIQMIKKLEPET